MREKSSVDQKFLITMLLPFFQFRTRIPTVPLPMGWFLFSILQKLSAVLFGIWIGYLIQYERSCQVSYGAGVRSMSMEVIEVYNLVITHKFIFMGWLLMNDKKHIGPPVEKTPDNEINERSIIPTSTPLFWVTGTPNEPAVVYSKRNLQEKVSDYLDEDPDSWLQDIDNYVLDGNAFEEHERMPVFKK